jgi:uncharacterized phage-associated protein
MATTASEVARHLIHHFCAKKQPISNLKLQKLLYYCQGWNLGFYDSPLFLDPIQAWIHGPVVPRVFREYRHYGWSPITQSLNAVLPAQSADLVRSVIVIYGGFSAAQLEQLSHSEDPWILTRGSLAPDCPSEREIGHAEMQKYFSHLANG